MSEIDSAAIRVSNSVYAHGADLFVFVFQEAHIMIITFYLKASHNFPQAGLVPN